MINQKDEALHKALKVLNCLNNDRVYETAWVKGAINACEEALEPQIELADTISVEDYQKLREQPTKEEILGKVFDAVYAQYQPKAETQEPVLYIDGGGLDGHATWAQATRCQDTDIALYTHPKEWQGLSDAELEELSSEEELMFWGFARAIEAKLKEKNG